MKVVILIFLSCVAVGIGAIAWRWYQTEIAPDDPFVPTMDVGAVVPVEQYRLSGPYTHGNLTMFLVHVVVFEH